jgi:hypothetical protein
VFILCFFCKFRNLAFLYPVIYDNSPPPVRKAGWGTEIISYRLAQSSVLRLVPEQVLPLVPEHLPA